MSVHDEARREVERALLGALLLDPGRLADVREIVEPADLADPRHAAVLRELARRLDVGEPVDIASLGAALGGPPERIRQPRSLLASIAGTVTGTAHLIHHAETVARYARLDRLRLAAQGLAEDAASAAPGQADDLLARAERELGSIGARPTKTTWEPYPVDALPETLRALALEGGASIGCDPAFVALPALVVCAGAIGLSRDVRIKRGWREPAVLWGAINAESGSAKDPTLDLAAEPLRELEASARRAYKRALAAWEEQCELLTAHAGKRKPKLPDEPLCVRRIVQDTTIEALARVLAVTPRGVTVVRGELSAWFRSWGEYKGGAGSDSAKWLELHGARALTVDRALAGGSLHVPRAAVSVVGGIQPGILRRVLGGENVESGCAARILFAAPPREPRRWRDAEIGENVRERYAEVVRALAALEPATVTYEDGETGLAPEGLPLTAEARELFAAWVNELGAEAVAYFGAEAAAAAKLEGGAARIALVVAVVRAAEQGRAADPSEIDAEALAAGITLAGWHWREARRVYALLGISRGPASRAEDPAARETRELLDLARERGGVLTVRDLRDRWGRYRATGAAEAALRRLADAGHGAVTVGERGGVRWTSNRPGPGGPGPTTGPDEPEGERYGTGTAGREGDGEREGPAEDAEEVIL